jgi:hypothetical protein
MAWPPSKVALNPALAAKLRAAGHGDMIAKPKRRNAQPEADLQKLVAQFLDAELTPRRIWWSSTLNGVRLKTARERGRAQEQGLRPGLPDIVIVPLTYPALTEAYFIEIKSARGTVTPEQAALAEALGPGRMAVCRSVDEVRVALVTWGMI